MNCFRGCSSILLLTLEARIRGRRTLWRAFAKRWRKLSPLPLIPFAELVIDWSAWLDRAS